MEIDEVRNFDFGFPDGFWYSRNVYLAEPVPGVGVVIYFIDGTKWNISFFPVWPEAKAANIKLPQMHAAFVLALTGDVELFIRTEHLHSARSDDLLSIICIINDRTIGENNVCDEYRSIIERIPYAKLEGAIGRSNFDGGGSKDVG